MIPDKSAMIPPEFLIYARYLATGFLGAEVWRAAFYLGANFASKLSDVALSSVILAGTLLCLTYALERGAYAAAARMCRSFRIDLLLAIGIGIWINELASPWFSKVHKALKSADPYWAPAVFLLLSVVLFAPLIRQYWPKPKRPASQMYFIADEEIEFEKDDLLASESQAKSFAETVLASGDHPGLVFGVDGPWGVGKTSFINLR